MVRSPILLLLLFAGAGASASVARAGAADEEFKRFLKEEITPRWEQEEVSQQRVVMIRGFARHDVPAAAEWLLDEVLAAEPTADVAHETVRTLGAYKNPATIRAFAEAWRKFRKPESAKALAVTAFGSIEGKLAEEVIREALDDREERVQIAACRAAGRRLGGPFRDELVELLEHRHRAVRGAALTAIAGIADESAMPEVFRAFASDPNPRVRYDAWLALKSLAKEDFPCDPAAWTDWWKGNHEAAGGDEAKDNPWGRSFPRINEKAGIPGTFFGIPVLAERVVFVLDVSLNMDDPWPIDVLAERQKPRDERTPNMFAVKTRWDLVRAHLDRCLRSMPESTEFAIVFFNSDIATYPERARFVRNNERYRERALEAAKEAERGSSTAMYEGLKKGWGFLRDGHAGKNFKSGADTIVFVTDGALSDGELKNQPDRLKSECWRVALLRNLRIHAVGLYNHDFDLCRCIAWLCGGDYVHAQPHNDTAEPQDLDFWPAKKKAWQKKTKKVWKNKVKHCG